MRASCRWLPLSFLVSLVFVSSVSAQHEYKTTRTLIRDNQLEKAVEVLQKNIAKDPKDSEWVSQSAIAYARLGQTELAMEALKKAVAMDAPPERFLAETTNLLKPFAQTAAFQAWQKQYKSPILNGPMLGCLTDGSVKVWLRTLGPQTVRVSYSKESTEKKTTTEPVTTSDKTDFTQVMTLQNLEANSAYTYDVEVQTGEAWKTEATGTFRTFASAKTPAKFRIAFGGGAGYVPQNERMWTTIESFDPEALLLLGDNVYIDMPESPEMQKFCYYRRHARPEFRRLIQNRPVFTIWDDHDFGTNDCSGGPAVDNPRWKPDVWNVYRQNWVNPGYGGGRERPGCWYDFQLGDVHFFMLDGRYYRTKPRTPSPTMLGPEQKAWLKTAVKNSKATFKVLVSPVPWEYRTKGDSKDTWNGFRDERKEIFDFLTAKKISGVLLMSADRHRSDAWKIDRPDDYPLYEFESSRLTNLHRHGPMKEAIFSYSGGPSFGLVEFDTKAKDPTVTYTVVTIEGKPVESLTIPLSQLQAR